MSTNDCAGYHWSQGQYIVSNCNTESSTFFIILGFTMLVLVLLLFVIVIIACIRRQRLRIRAQRSSPPLASQENEDDCVINLDGIGQIGGSSNGRDLENVKTVIMAGEDKPTYIAHPVPSSSPSSSDSQPVEEEGQEVNPGEPSSEQVVPHSEEVSLEVGPAK